MFELAILTIPGEFLQMAKSFNLSKDHVSEFRLAMQKLKPTDTANHITPRTFF